MIERLYRATPADLEIRGDGDGRTVVGLAVPFDHPALIDEGGGSTFTEVFRRGAFAKTIAERPGRVKVFGKHQRSGLPVGRASALREDPAGLYAELRISATPDGDNVLELVRDGTLDALSIGFQPIRNKWSPKRDTVERLEAKLHEISVVDFPAYSNALISGVRGSGRVLTQAAAQARLRLIQKDPNL